METDDFVDRASFESWFTDQPYVSASGFLFGNALTTAKVLVVHRACIEERLGLYAPTWNALFVDLCDRLERHTPLGDTKKKD